MWFLLFGAILVLRVAGFVVTHMFDVVGLQFRSGENVAFQPVCYAGYGLDIVFGRSQYRGVCGHSWRRFQTSHEFRTEHLCNNNTYLAFRCQFDADNPPISGQDSLKTVP